MIFEAWGTDQKVLVLDDMLGTQDERPSLENALSDDLILKQTKKCELQISIHSTDTNLKTFISNQEQIFLKSFEIIAFFRRTYFYHFSMHFHI